MNKTITIYELLGLVKDGKAPKKIKVTGNIYEYDEEFKFYLTQTKDGRVCLGGLLNENNLLANCLNENEVEIIEDNDKLKHGENYVDFANLTEDSKFDYLYEMESRIIDHINKIEEKLDEK